MDQWNVKVKKGQVSKRDSERFEVAINKIGILKYTGKKGPSKRKVNQDATKTGSERKGQTKCREKGRRA